MCHNRNRGLDGTVAEQGEKSRVAFVQAVDAKSGTRKHVSWFNDVSFGLVDIGPVIKRMRQVRSKRDGAN